MDVSELEVGKLYTSLTRVPFGQLVWRYNGKAVDFELYDFKLLPALGYPDANCVYTPDPDQQGFFRRVDPGEGLKLQEYALTVLEEEAEFRVEVMIANGDLCNATCSIFNGWATDIDPEGWVPLTTSGFGDLLLTTTIPDIRDCIPEGGLTDIFEESDFESVDLKRVRFVL